MPETIKHPTKEEYAYMDGLRFPFILNEENVLKEAKYQRFERIKKIKFGDKERNKLEERIKKLIYENKKRFFDPRIGEEIHPVVKRNSWGWDKHG
jgi:isopentenyl diphosphate isomerase/L-lactate dehydrogenase-like FMN-dependent dehydrogenase